MATKAKTKLTAATPRATEAQLKEYFSTGKKPTGEQFAELIDFANQPGPQGPAGKDGTNGTDGEQGIQGLPGKDGMNGTDGAKGDKGDTGERGPQGEPGQGGSTPLNNTLTSTATNEAATANVAKQLNDKITPLQTDVTALKRDVLDMSKNGTILMTANLTPGNDVTFTIGENMALVFHLDNSTAYKVTLKGTNAFPTKANSASYMMSSQQAGMYFTNTTFYDIDNTYSKELFPNAPIEFNTSFVNLMFEEVDNGVAYALDINAFSDGSDKHRIVMEVSRYVTGRF